MLPTPSSKQALNIRLGVECWGLFPRSPANPRDVEAPATFLTRRHPTHKTPHLRLRPQLQFRRHISPPCLQALIPFPSPLLLSFPLYILSSPILPPLSLPFSLFSSRLFLVLVLFLFFLLSFVCLFLGGSFISLLAGFQCRRWRCFQVGDKARVGG